MRSYDVDAECAAVVYAAPPQGVAPSTGGGIACASCCRRFQRDEVLTCNTRRNLRPEKAQGHVGVLLELPVPVAYSCMLKLDMWSVLSGTSVRDTFYVDKYIDTALKHVKFGNTEKG